MDVGCLNRIHVFESPVFSRVLNYIAYERLFI